MKIYMASSWRNDRLNEVATILAAAGHQVFDFRRPSPGDNGFHWSDIDPDWQRWSTRDFVLGLKNPLAVAGFRTGMGALEAAECVVLVLPCGRSAHLELGWAIGQGKRGLILLDGKSEPELMYGMAELYGSIAEVLRAVGGRRPAVGPSHAG